MGWLILSGFFLSLQFAFWIASLKYTSVASSVVLVTTHPIFVGIGSRLFLKERMGVYLILGIILSVFGSALISYGDMTLSEKALMGDGLALLGAISRQIALLAREISFEHPTRRETLTFTAPAPAGWPWPMTEPPGQAPFWNWSDYAPALRGHNW